MIFSPKQKITKFKFGSADKKTRLIIKNNLLNSLSVINKTIINGNR